jgi:hypothetical protein
MARGPVGHIYFISRCEKLVKGILVKEFPQASTDLRRKRKLTVTICASSSPAAEHVFGVPALALIQFLSLLQQKDTLNAEIGQSKGRKNTGRAGTNDYHFVIHGFPPRRLSENGYFPQSLRQAQIIILEILRCIPVVIIFAFLDLAKTISFSDNLLGRIKSVRFVHPAPEKIKFL